MRRPSQQKNGRSCRNCCTDSLTSLFDSDIGRTEMIQNHINPRQAPFHHLKEVKKLVENVLDNNVIEPSNGSWANSVGEEE